MMHVWRRLAIERSIPDQRHQSCTYRLYAESGLTRYRANIVTHSWIPNQAAATSGDKPKLSRKKLRKAAKAKQKAKEASDMASTSNHDMSAIESTSVTRPPLAPEAPATGRTDAVETLVSVLTKFAPF